MSLPVHALAGEAFDDLSRFRVQFYESLDARADALFELTDAVLCADGPVKTLVELSLAVEHRRGHGALYAGLGRGRVEPARLRRALAGLRVPRAADGRIVLAVDVSNWLRPDAPTSNDRLFCHVYGRGGRSRDQFVPGWPYSFVAALETGRTSWVALLDAVRLGPADDATAVTAAQLRDTVDRLIDAGQWQAGDPDIWIVMDSGYDIAYLSHALADLPVVLVGRVRSDRVMLRDPGPAGCGPKGGRPRRHGGVLAFAKPESWHEPEVTAVTGTARYGTAEARAWDRMHPRLSHRGAWLNHADEELPVLHGTLIRLTVERLPGDRDPKPVWLWCSATAATPADVKHWWQSFLRRFDLEHTFRLTGRPACSCVAYSAGGSQPGHGESHWLGPWVASPQLSRRLCRQRPLLGRSTAAWSRRSLSGSTSTSMPPGQRERRDRPQYRVQVMASAAHLDCQRN